MQQHPIWRCGGWRWKSLAAHALKSIPWKLSSASPCSTFLENRRPEGYSAVERKRWFWNPFAKLLYSVEETWASAWWDLHWCRLFCSVAAASPWMGPSRNNDFLSSHAMGKSIFLQSPCFYTECPVSVSFALLWCVWEDKYVTVLKGSVCGW